MKLDDFRNKFCLGCYKDCVTQDDVIDCFKAFKAFKKDANKEGISEKEINSLGKSVDELFKEIYLEEIDE